MTSELQIESDTIRPLTSFLSATVAERGGPAGGMGIMSSTRRHFLAATATTSLLSLAATGRNSEAELEATATATATATADDELPPPRYQLAMNLEIMFPRTMPY